MDNQYTELKNFDKFTPKGNLKVDEICQKAAQVFADKGFSSTRLTDISHFAGISKGCIYHYFSTKEELLFVILSRYMDKILEEQKKIIEMHSTSPHENIRLFILQHITYYSKNLHESRLILHELLNLTPIFRNLIKGKEQEYLNLLKFLIASLFKDRHMSNDELNMITYSLIGMCNWPYRWYNPNGSITTIELANEIYRIFIGDLPIKQLSKLK